MFKKIVLITFAFVNLNLFPAAVQRDNMPPPEPKYKYIKVTCSSHAQLKNFLDEFYTVVRYDLMDDLKPQDSSVTIHMEGWLWESEINECLDNVEEFEINILSKKDGIVIITADDSGK